MDQYKDPRWQKKRLEILKRDKFQCQSCFNTENTLNVHHKYYIYGRKPWEYPNDLLVTFCEGCHQLEEDKKYIITDFTKVLLSRGYLATELVSLLDTLLKFEYPVSAIIFIEEALHKYQNFSILKKDG